jgi:hypothetical protein
MDNAKPGNFPEMYHKLRSSMLDQLAGDEKISHRPSSKKRLDLASEFLDHFGQSRCPLIFISL